MTRRSRFRLIAAGTIGNVLEFYGFAIYGYFAVSLGRTFFPQGDPVAQVLAAFGVFAVGFLMRPLGGLLTGYIGDRYGRRVALSYSVTAMAVPTFLVGLLPGYATIGIAAPILLIVLRVIRASQSAVEPPPLHLHGRAPTRPRRPDGRDQHRRHLGGADGIGCRRGAGIADVG